MSDTLKIVRHLIFGLTFTHVRSFSFIRVFILAQLLSTIAAAQTPDFKFRHLGVKDGFSTDALTAIFKDSRGFLWASSFDGLNRYDGHHVVIYRHQPNDPKSIAENGTNVIAEDSLKNIWVGCENGFVSRYNFETNSFTNFDLKSPADTNYFFGKQTCFVYSCAGNIWAFHNNEFYHFDFASEKFIFYDTSDPDSRVGAAKYFCIGISRNQKIYFRNHGELEVMNANGSNRHHYFRDSSDARFFNTQIVPSVYPLKSCQRLAALLFLRCRILKT